MILKPYSKKDYFEIQKAILFLNQSFSNVKDGSKPELLHSLHTGFRLIDYGYPLKIIIAGFLHDVIEEGKGHEDIKNLFGEEIYKIVFANSKNKSLPDWRSQYDELITKTVAYGEEALIVKAADVLDNLIYVFEIDYDLGKEKTTYMAKKILKHTDSTDRVFGELRQVYEYWNNKK